MSSVQFSLVQSLSNVRLFASLWIAASQASLSIINSWSTPKAMSIELVMLSKHLTLCRPLLLLPSIFSSIRVFSNESALRIRWPKYWSFSFNIRPFPLNTQERFPFWCTGWISLQSKGLSRISLEPEFKSINSLVLRYLYSSTLTSIHDYWENHSFD